MPRISQLKKGSIDKLAKRFPAVKKGSHRRRYRDSGIEDYYETHNFVKIALVKRKTRGGYIHLDGYVPSYIDEERLRS